MTGALVTGALATWIMKIIGGVFKGRRIDMPKRKDIRPTSDKVREALFNIIKNRIDGATVLDLFAGSGSVGIEAISWGAKDVTLVDIQKGCINAIRRNLKRLPISQDRIDIIQGDALKAIKRLSDTKMRFDLVFLDPPYYGDWIKKCLISLDDYGILYDYSIIVCEHFKKDVVPEEVGSLKMVRQKRYGDTVLTFYEKSGISRNI